MEAEKSGDVLSASWRPRGAGGGFHLNLVPQILRIRADGTCPGPKAQEAWMPVSQAIQARELRCSSFAFSCCLGSPVSERVVFTPSTDSNAHLSGKHPEITFHQLPGLPLLLC